MQKNVLPEEIKDFVTNILRDIKEDFERDRIYLPQEEMKEYKVTEETLAVAKIDKSFIDLLKFQIQRARIYYQSADKGIKMITLSQKKKF